MIPIEKVKKLVEEGDPKARVRFVRKLSYKPKHQSKAGKKEEEA